MPGCGGLEGFVRSQNPRALVRNRVLGGASVLGTGFGDFRNSSINATLVLVNQAPVFSMVIYTHVYMWVCLMGMLLRETCFMSGGHIQDSQATFPKLSCSVSDLKVKLGSLCIES